MVKIGDAVVYVDPSRKEHNAIVICVFPRSEVQQPLINVVLADPDPGKDDPYGRQIMRETSVSPMEDNQEGRYWKKK